MFSLLIGLAQGPPTRIKLAVLSFGETNTGKLATSKFANQLRQDDRLALIDLDLSKAAAAGAGYTGSLNLSVDEARDLGAALGCDFFVIGDAQTLRRSPSTGAIYFESYASIFLVSARTGRLLEWLRPVARGERAEDAERLLLSQLSSAETRQKLTEAVLSTRDRERTERALAVDQKTPVIEAAPDDEKTAETEGLRLPRPFRRLTPLYPESAETAEVEAIVDVLADIDASGEVQKVEIARWAGFGLDESTVNTVQRLHFFPAMRNGVAIPLRVLLRYNFRKPPRNP
jgi:TonB family protein